MTDTTSLLVVTVRENDSDIYEEGLKAIQKLERGSSVEQPDRVTFPNETLLARTFNERTYTLLRIIRDEDPTSIRETARLVGRDVKNVHEELTQLEAMGVIRLDEDGQSKRPVFPYDELAIMPFAHGSGDTASAAP